MTLGDRHRPGWAREYFLKRQRAGLCANCGQKRGKNGTTTSCRKCADKVNADKRLKRSKPKFRARLKVNAHFTRWPQSRRTLMAILLAAGKPWERLPKEYRSQIKPLFDASLVEKHGEIYVPSTQAKEMLVRTKCGKAMLRDVLNFHLGKCAKCVPVLTASF